MSVLSASDSTNTSGQQTVRFSGVNVQIVSGAGSTEAAVNGTGNLIIGYNELRNSGNDRTGSHNFVSGLENNYSHARGIVLGYHNTSSNVGAYVLGGESNTASGIEAIISGGSSSVAGGTLASVSGGNQNTASGNFSSVSGGYFSTASGNFSSVSGGRENTASGNFSSVSGGSFGSATGLEDWRAGDLFQDF